VKTYDNFHVRNKINYKKRVRAKTDLNNKIFEQVMMGTETVFETSVILSN